LVAVTAVAVGAFLGASPASWSNTYKPTRFDDPSPGKCKPGDCSLREALVKANDRNGKDTIVLGKGTYRMEITDTTGLGDESGDFNIFDAVTIRGLGPKNTKVDANGRDRVFPVGSSGTVKLQGLAVKDGDSGANPGHTSVGGGVLALGDRVILDHVAIRGNAAQLGGGVWSVSPDLVIRDSTIAGNNAGEGGGIHVVAAQAEPITTIRGTTISGNAAAKGGGLLADGSAVFGSAPPTVGVLNSTIAENHASGEAGGLMADNEAAVTLEYATVVDNRADDDGLGGGDAGGIYQHSGATFTFNYSILARNTVGASGQGPECGGTITGHTVAVEGQGGSVCTFNVSPYFTIDPANRRLGILKDNGGPTQTVNLLSGSGAIGFGFECPPRDQRGKPRPADDCDVGAFERKNP
jgi:hypothetical protein